MARILQDPEVFTTRREIAMERGSTANVIAAIASFFIPGLGQLAQARLPMALIHFVLGWLLWLVWLGWVVHLWSTLDAALYRAPLRFARYGSD